MSWDDMFSQSEESNNVFLPFNYLNVAQLRPVGCFKNETIYLTPGLGL